MLRKLFLLIVLIGLTLALTDLNNNEDRKGQVIKTNLKPVDGSNQLKRDDDDDDDDDDDEDEHDGHRKTSYHHDYSYTTSRYKIKLRPVQTTAIYEEYINVEDDLIKRKSSGAKVRVFQFTIINDLSYAVKLYWVDYNGNLIYLKTFRNESSELINSFYDQEYFITSDSRDINKGFRLGRDNLFLKSFSTIRMSTLLKYSDYYNKNLKTETISLDFSYLDERMPSIKTNEKFFFTIKNDLEYDLKLYWINFSGNFQYHDTILIGSKLLVESNKDNGWYLTSDSIYFNKGFRCGYDNLFKISNSFVLASEFLSYNGYYANSL